MDLPPRGGDCLRVRKQTSLPKTRGERAMEIQRGVRLSAATLATLAIAFGAAAKGSALSIHTLSSRPQFVSGGDALVEVRGATKGVTLTLNGKDVSGDLKLDPA